MADSQNHDCKDLSNKIVLHDTRIQKLEEFKLQTALDLQASKSFHENMLKEMTIVSAETKSIASNQQTIQLDMAEERGRREQSSKNLYLFIALVGIAPKLIDMLASIKLGH